MVAAQNHNKHDESTAVLVSTHQRGVWGRVWRWVPPHSLVDVDIMDKEGNEMAEEKMELEQHVTIHG